MPFIDPEDRPRFERLCAYHRQLHGDDAPPDADMDDVERLVQTAARGLLSRFVEGQVLRGALNAQSILTRLSRAACSTGCSPSDILIGILELWSEAIARAEAAGEVIIVPEVE